MWRPPRKIQDSGCHPGAHRKVQNYSDVSNGPLYQKI